VLQLLKRIEFNKKFGHASASQETSPLVETLPGTSSRPTELRDEEIRPDRTQHLALEMSTSFEGSDSDMLSAQPQSSVNLPEPPEGDWAPATSETRTNQRSRATSRRGRGFEINTRHSRVQRQTQSAARLHRLKSDQEPRRNLKPLSLMNPVSEILKVNLRHYRVL